MAARRIFGVDFSAAADAGRKIWLAKGRSDGLRLMIESCHPAADLPGSGDRREDCLPALVQFIGDQRDAVFGCDFPFSLPGYLVGDAGWRQFVQAFPRLHRSAKRFREHCARETIRVTAARRKECRRETDKAAKTPWAAWNVRLYRQTYHGLRDVLHPLVKGRSAAVLPWHAASEDRAWVLETCPASTLKAEGLYLSYKGKDPERTGNRLRILEALTKRYLARPVPAATRRAVRDSAGGDALDSVVAAVAAHRAVANGLGPPGDAVEALEGKVYFRVCFETGGALAR